MICTFLLMNAWHRAGPLRSLAAVGVLILADVIAGVLVSAILGAKMGVGT